MWPDFIPFTCELLIFNEYHEFTTQHQDWNLTNTLSKYVPLPAHTQGNHTPKFGIYHSLALKKIALLTYNWCTINCTYLKCTIWWAWTQVYDPATITKIKAMNISITHPNSFILFCNPSLQSFPCSLTPSPDKPWSAFCHHNLDWIF